VAELTSKVGRMEKEMLQRAAKTQMSTASASYAVAAVTKAAPGKSIRFISCDDRVTLVAKEQSMPER
jgi:hypothetical protein